MKKTIVTIPIIILLANVAVLLDIPILREIIVFIFLSFIPGFLILRLFKLRAIGFLGIFLFSVALSIAAVMFVGFLVNELYLFLGLSQPLSPIPLTVAISALVLTLFFIEYKRDMSEISDLRKSPKINLRHLFPLFSILFLLPLLGALSVLYFNAFAILITCAIIAALCVISVVFRRLIPENLFPLLIFSISITLVFQGLLISKYIVGYDANLEYYVFKLTQINGHWGYIDTISNSLGVLSLNSLLSITVLPTVYSVLMNAEGEIVFKILYSFVLSLLPLAIYLICEKQFGKLIGLCSSLFFVFTASAFYGPEPLSLNRQIVGALFLMLSVFLLTSSAIPVRKRRILLVVFGAALPVSHYSLAYAFLGIVAVFFIIQRVKPKFSDTLNATTSLFLFLLPFVWYSLWSSPLTSFTNIVERIFTYFTTGLLDTALPIVTASSIFAPPQVFTVASWINLLLSGTASLFLLIGFLLVILRPKSTGISVQYYVILIMAAILLAVSFTPGVASILNFTRFYALSLLFLSPCFVLGGKTFLTLIGKAWMKIRQPPKRQAVPKSKNTTLALMIVAILLGAYFLSQVGFVNRVTNSSVHSYTIDYDKINSDKTQDRIFFLSVYSPKQDVFSASWLQSHRNETSEVFADIVSKYHSLASYGLVPTNLVLPFTSETTLLEGRFVYLGSLNTVNDVLIAFSGSLNRSEILIGLDHNNLVYSNGKSEIWSVIPTY